MTLSLKPQTKRAVIKSVKPLLPIRLVHRFPMRMLLGKAAKSQSTTKRRTKLTELPAKNLQLQSKPELCESE
jgi:hypothetical protein